MSLLRLFRQFILRALVREKGRSVVAAAGMALGVAVTVAVRLANTSVTDTFEAAVDSVTGDAALRIRGASGRFDELRLRELRWLETDHQFSPVIEAYAMVVAEETRRQTGGMFTRGELLHVLGVDILLDFGVRDYHILQTGQRRERSAREILSLLQDPNSVILTEKFLRRKGLRVGDDIRLAFGSRQQTFRIRGVLLNQGPARTLDGNFALMDIAAAQLAADRLGLIDYVDLRLAENTDRDALLVQIRQRLPAGLVVEFPDAASSRADTMISAFQFNLTALSGVALLVGLFLIYNTVSMSVAARREEIGILRAAGAGKKTVLVLFLGEAALLAVVGIVLGLPLGRLLASFAVRGTAQTVETFYIAGVAEASASALRLSTGDVLATVTLTLPLALLAALLPAWEAASVQPVEAVRGAGLRLTKVRLQRCVAAALVCLAIGWSLTRCEPVYGRPVFGFVAELFFMIGGALFTPVILWLVCQAARSWAPSLMPLGRTEVRLASANLLSALPRVSISAAALAVSLSMMIAIAVMVGSFRKTVIYWLDSVLSADLSVKPVMQSSSVSEARLSKPVLETLSNDRDVVDTVWFASRQIPLGDRTIRVTVTSTSLQIAPHRGRTNPDRPGRRSAGVGKLFRSV
jgi:putative ABC transport system permease protein